MGDFNKLKESGAAKGSFVRVVGGGEEDGGFGESIAAED